MLTLCVDSWDILVLYLLQVLVVGLDQFTYLRSIVMVMSTDLQNVPLILTFLSFVLTVMMLESPVSVAAIVLVHANVNSISVCFIAN